MRFAFLWLSSLVPNTWAFGVASGEKRTWVPRIGGIWRGRVHRLHPLFSLTCAHWLQNSSVLRFHRERGSSSMSLSRFLCVAPRGQLSKSYRRIDPILGDKMTKCNVSVGHCNLWRNDFSAREVVIECRETRCIRRLSLARKSSVHSAERIVTLSLCVEICPLVQTLGWTDLRPLVRHFVSVALGWKSARRGKWILEMWRASHLTKSAKWIYVRICLSEGWSLSPKLSSSTWNQILAWTD